MLGASVTCVKVRLLVELMGEEGSWPVNHALNKCEECFKRV